MVGGAISGYCATGSRKNATPPRITNTIETTEAKIGRLIKKCEMRIGFGRGYFDVCGGLAPCAGTAPGLPSSCGVTFSPGRARISPFTLARSSGSKTAFDHPQVIAGGLPEHHVFGNDRVVGVDREYEFPCLLGADGRIRQ